MLFSPIHTSSKSWQQIRTVRPLEVVVCKIPLNSKELCDCGLKRSLSTMRCKSWRGQRWLEVSWGGQGQLTSLWTSALLAFGGAASSIRALTNLMAIAFHGLAPGSANRCLSPKHFPRPLGRYLTKISSKLVPLLVCQGFFQLFCLVFLAWAQSLAFQALSHT